MVAVPYVRLLVQQHHFRALGRLQRGGREIYRRGNNPEDAGRGQVICEIHAPGRARQFKPPARAAKAEIHRAVQDNQRRSERAAAREPDELQKRVRAEARPDVVRDRRRGLLRHGFRRRHGRVRQGRERRRLSDRVRLRQRGARLSRSEGLARYLGVQLFRHVHDAHRARRKLYGQHEPQRGHKPERVYEPRRNAVLEQQPQQRYGRYQHARAQKQFSHDPASPPCREFRAARQSRCRRNPLPRQSSPPAW